MNAIVKACSLQRLLLGLVVVTFLTTATHKIYALSGDKVLRLAPDPLLFFLSNEVLWKFTATLEFAISILILFGKNSLVKLYAVFWSSSVFICYRLGLVVIGYKKGCLCLGRPMSWHSVLGNKFHEDAILKTILAFMFLGSLWFLRQDIRSRFKGGLVSDIDPTLIKH